jgi:hypothetical protein
MQKIQYPKAMYCENIGQSMNSLDRELLRVAKKGKHSIDCSHHPNYTGHNYCLRLGKQSIIRWIFKRQKAILIKAYSSIMHDDLHKLFIYP